MEMIVFAAVILAAALHAIWNALVKKGSDQYLSMGAVVLGHTPFAVAAALISPLPAAASLPYAVAGAGLHLGYQLFLLHSYRAGDLTQVYPIARGSAPLIVAFISMAFLGVVLSSAEIISVLMIGIGIMSLVFVRNADGRLNMHAARLALVTGCFIAAYSLVDGMGARQAGTALGFYAWLSILNSIAFAAIMAVMKPGLLLRIAREAPRVSLFGGGASFAAFSLVVWAFTKAPIPLVTVLRETSIIFALLIGVFFLKERVNLAKVLSTAMTLSGAVLLKFSR